MGDSRRKQTTEALHQQKLVNEYTYSYQQSGMTHSDAKKRAEEFVQAGISEVASRGWENQPPDIGYSMLKEQQTNTEIAVYLTALRREGVTDDDIRWWWNMPALDRVLIEKTDDELRLSAFVICMKKGMTPADAAKYVFKANPKYGELLDTDDPDRPIPIELKRRIVEWSEKHCQDLNLLRRKLEKASSFNALVRSEVIKLPGDKNQTSSYEPPVKQSDSTSWLVWLLGLGILFGVLVLAADAPGPRVAKQRPSNDKEIDSPLNDNQGVQQTPSRIPDELHALSKTSAFDGEINGEVRSTNDDKINNREGISSAVAASLDDNGRYRHPLIYVAVGNNTQFRLWFKGSSKREAEELKLDGLAGDKVYFVTMDADAISASILDLSSDDLKELALAIGDGSGVFLGETLETRTWTDSTGKYTRDASFAGRSGNVVFLHRKDPQPHLIAVELVSLSQADRDYVGSQIITIKAHPVER
ncbi:MAG TPA: hypothetical protein DDZ51_07955 [Planctomycetaceae bacterium]|nr:hypothetical protein [Planctomycetaceae bacterium]